MEINIAIATETLLIDALHVELILYFNVDLPSAYVKIDIDEASTY